jgi:hypothetical protein
LILKLDSVFRARANVKANAAAGTRISVNDGMPCFHGDGIFYWTLLCASGTNRTLKREASSRIDDRKTHGNGRVKSKHASFARWNARHIIAHQARLRLRIDDGQSRHNPFALWRPKNSVRRASLKTSVALCAADNKF